MPSRTSGRSASRPNKTWVEISKSALLANAAAMRGILGERTLLLAAIKAGAYGHGIANVADILDGSKHVDWFAVDNLGEAREIREVSKKPVLLLGYTRAEELAAAVKENISLTVYNPETIAALAKLGTVRQPAKVHVKLDTGLSRQGVLPKDLPAFAKVLRRHARTVQVEGADMHFANIEDTTDPTYALAQIEKFHAMVETMHSHGIRPRLVHSACSAAIMLHEATHSDMARSGIALYGLWPSKETRVSMGQRAPALQLQPVLTWKTIVAQVKALPAGTPISYGLTEKVTRASRVAVIPIGYWDGFDRGQSSVGHVLIRGRRAKVLGRVCMNMFVVDVTDIPGVKPEDEVVLIGKQGKEEISAEEFAGRIGTINYEAVTRINPLIPRVTVQ